MTTTIYTPPTSLGHEDTPVPLGSTPLGLPMALARGPAGMFGPALREGRDSHTAGKHTDLDRDGAASARTDSVAVAAEAGRGRGRLAAVAAPA